MKKKLILGFVLIFIILSVGAVVVIRSLDIIVINQNLINEQDGIIGKYNEMLFQIKGAQAELYRHQAGYSRNINNLVSYIESFDETMAFLSKEYTGRLHDVACMQCHGKIEERLTSLTGIFKEVKQIIKNYKEDVSIILTSNDVNQTRLLEDSAAQKGIVIVEMIEKVRHAADKMRSDIKDKRNILITRSRMTIFLTISLTVFSSLIIFIWIIRGITSSVDSLIKGIQKIASGDFSQRVSVGTQDEIGFIANAFNNMAAKLSAMNAEKDKLLYTLRGFNEELETKVKEATEKLRLTQENMLRAETLAAIGTLAAGLSHEISTPVSTILGLTQMILSGLDDNNSNKADLKLIEQEAIRCDKIIKGLLNFAKPQKHEERLININSIINDTLLLIEYQPSMRKITIKRELSKELNLVEADPLQLKQVFLNLILNAVQAMPEGGELKITTANSDKYLEDKYLEITIFDTGVGISVEEQQKIFQPFYSTKKDGTGLGLSISYGIIKEHGGEIFVESLKGRGTKIRIYLPVSNAIKDSRVS
jgi:two-component system NtrC family sensor kinase